MADETYPYRYKAFISYSHRSDGKLAPALQTAIQTFAKPWYRLRSFKVFRDDTSLTVSEALWPAIQKSLNESEYFLLMASPAAASSKWVKRELCEWLEHHSPRTVLILLTDGDLAWSDSRQDFDWDNTTAVPRAMSGVWDQEPFYIDLRWARSETQLSPRHPRFRDAVATIAATLRATAKEDLIGDDVSQHKRAMRLARAAAITLAALAVLLSVAGGIAVYQTRLAVANEKRARTHLVVNAASLILSKDPALAALLMTELRGEPEPQAGTSAAQRIATYAIPHTILRDPADEPVLVATFDSDGKKVIALTPTAVKIWDLSHRSVPPLVRKFGGQITVPVAFSPDRRRVAVLLHDLSRAPQLVVIRIDADSEPVTLEGHTEVVRDIEFANDGQRIVTASDDGTARVWRADGKGNPVILRGHSSRLVSSRFSPDGSRIVTASADGTARVWHADGSGRPLTFRAPNAGSSGRGVTSAVFSPDGRSILSTSDDRTAQIWTVGDSQKPLLLSADAAVTDAIFSPDGKRVATMSDDWILRVFPVDEPESPIVFPKNEGPIQQLIFSPVGDVVVTTSWGAADGPAIRIWRLDGNRAPMVLRGHERTYVNAAFSPDGKQLVTTSGDPTARIWSVAAAAQPMLLYRQADEETKSVTFTPDGRYVLAVFEDGTVTKLSPDGRRSAEVLRSPSESVPKEIAFNAAFSGDGQFVAMASLYDHSVNIWRLEGSQKVATLKGHQDVVKAMQFSPDGRRLLTASADGTARIWMVDMSREPVVLDSPDSANSLPGFHDATFGPDGQLVLAGTGDGKVMQWQLDGSGRSTVVDDFPALPITSIAIAPDGRRLAVALDDLVRVRDLTGSSSTLVLQGHDTTVWKTAFSPDGHAVLTLATIDGTARVWRVDAVAEPVILRPRSSSLEDTFLQLDAFTCAAFSPDGKRLVTGSLDGSIYLWSINWEELITLLSNATTACLTIDQRQRLLAETLPIAQRAYESCNRGR